MRILLRLFCLAVLAPLAFAGSRVRIGVENNIEPLSFIGEDGRPAGFTAEFLAALEKTGKVEFELVPAPWTVILRQFEAGEIDALANVTVREERRRSMDFSISHAFVHGVVYFPTGSPRLRRTADFAGKRIAVLSGSIAHMNAMEHGGWGATIVPFPLWSLAMEAVRQGRCDAGLFIRGYREEVKESYRYFDSEYVEDIIHEYRIAVHKGDSRTLEKINDAIAIVRGNGTFDSIYAKWIGPLEPHPIRVADLRPFLLPAVLGIAVVVGIFWWQRMMLVRLARRTAALRASEERWKFAIEGAGEAVLDVNVPRGTVVFSPRWAAMLGYRPDAIGDRLEEWKTRIHPDDRAAVEAQLEEHLAGRTPSCVNEHRLQCRDGRYVWVLSRSLVVSRDANGQPLRLIGTHSDITERKDSEKALREASAAAEESARLKSQFLANVSHEIRTPINGVLGALGLLLDSPLAENQRSLAGIANTSAESLLTIINDILDFSRIEAGQLVFEAAPFDLRDPVEGSLELLADRAAAKGIELVYLIDPEVTTSLIGDAGRLRQVLLNLAGNAVKFTDRGEVVLGVSQRVGDAGRVRLRFEVRDTGIGIPADQLPRLFQPFVQADGSTTRKYGGSGLGLAICRQLVGFMGGELGVESEEGCGSTFWFTAEFAPAPAGAVPARERRAAVAGKRGLVVDDNASSCEALRRQLAALGIEATVATDAGGALQQWRSAEAAGRRFDFALVDQQMPGKTGVQLARELQQEKPAGGAKIVLLTSIRQPLAPAELAAAGINRCLSKPVREGQLLDALEMLFTLDAPLPQRVTPETTPAPDEPERTAASDGAEGERALRILVAEDNRVNQLVIRKQLEKFGYHPVLVENGALAVAAVMEQRFDLILMDCQMPEMDGLEATRRIRAWEAERQAAGSPCRPVHIVALTAHALKGDREECLAAGMNDYLSKPVRPEAFAAALGRAPRAR